jgi:hypothetical protein
MQISCREVRKELENCMEEDVSPELRERIERHFLNCDGCFAIYDGCATSYGWSAAQN